MTILRLLNPQGLAGLAVSLCLAILLVIQIGDARHWKKESAQFEQLYRGEQSAFTTTVANYRAASDAARAADKANADRVASEQRTINERTIDDYETRLAAARARADQLRDEAAGPATDRGDRDDSPMPGIPAASSRIAESSGQARLPAADALTATEQAIQLDELINWVRQQHAVRVDGVSGEGPQAKVDANAKAANDP